MQYTIAAMALAGFAAALPQDNYAYGGYSSAPAEYTTTAPASYPTTTEEKPASYPTTTEEKPAYSPTTTEEKPTEYKPTKYASSSVAPSYYASSSSVKTAPAYYPGSSTQTAPAYYPTTSEVSKCPAPGMTDSVGRYSCNPAHQYPDGQICDLVDGCYFLRTVTPGVSATPYTTTVEQYTTYCPSATTVTAHGKTYTATSATTITVCPGNCVVTSTSMAPPVYTTSTVSAYTTVCPTPTTIYTHGQTYPVTKPAQTVTICKDACTVTQPAMPSGSAYVCPAPGSTDSMGRYSCNPAHQYPAGQECKPVDNCFFLIGRTPSAPAGPSGTGAYMPHGNDTKPSMPATYTGGAAIASAAPVALLALGALFL
ncbi:hypothetical protein CLAFUW4_10319 [Fulvia fulva]|uniref:Uncharacterized protein n=1 Tax=Passalora fulva TaxID=5499 RepID=A0A1P8YY68_PASFU|nr:uncharacterized protein CLAFUR5_04932 [Fulvia fulva]AQA29305.1 hypothetical protein 12 [Fulvia fulva]KAK4615853.1 hypothetical protein CLAFUR4_10323 [Fulvia fulva]KAK4616757.1 hypothetical protein CLAFUR0_10321 [Fulvia fulva]UJO16627.1 hypothetical protein CLAFUR5_04932 [Fulvia fulva]WPV19534.1 hypothetical protein CLAFUW4_10319 [Fulvia fulva]